MDEAFHAAKQALLAATHLAEKYSALFACYSSIRHFRHMLEGHSFTIYADHKLLTSTLARVSDP